MSSCSKCESRATLICEECDLVYCASCSERRHSRGAFTRHAVRGIPCEECTDSAAILRCSACELDLCENCCTEIHSSGSMTTHAEQGAIESLAHQSPASGRYSHPPGLSTMFHRGSATSTQTEGDAPPAGCASDDDTVARSVSSLEDAIGRSLATELELGSESNPSAAFKYRTWSGWDLFPQSGSQPVQWSKHVRLVPPTDATLQQESAGAISSDPRKYQSLSALPVVPIQSTTSEPDSPDSTTASQQGSNAGPESDSIHGSTQGGSGVQISPVLPNHAGYEARFRPFISQVPTRTLLVRNVAHTSATPLWQLFSTHGDIRHMYMQFKAFNIAFVVCFDITHAIRMRQQLQGTVVAGGVQLDIHYSVPLRSGTDDCNDGVVHVVAPQDVSDQDIEATLTSVAGPVYEMRRRDIIHFADVRHAEVALRASPWLCTLAPIDPTVHELSHLLAQLLQSWQACAPDNVFLPPWDSNTVSPVQVPRPLGTLPSVHHAVPPVPDGWGFATSPMHSASAAAANLGLVPDHGAGANGTSRKGGNNKPARSNGNSGRQGRNNNRGNDDGSFSLDVACVLSGQDMRTTLMVRNIPNKYSQQMLLTEINERHRGLYDFFYLPIDFRNKCNVGYAFINFIQPADIVPFYQQFNGQRWSSFNSEKVCAITYARIQGRAAMIARFQNSSLMNKTGEYRPLLFKSSGPNRGEPEPFPTGRTRSSSTSSNGTNGGAGGNGGGGSGGNGRRRRG